MTDPDIDLITRTAGDTMAVRRVFGEPYEQDGVMLVPVASVTGGSGTGFGGGQLGGSQDAATGSGEGSGGGGGFGARVRPLGVYVVRGQDVRWRPAIDARRVGTQLVVLAIAIGVLSRFRRCR